MAAPQDDGKYTHDSAGDSALPYEHDSAGEEAAARSVRHAAK